MMRGKFITFEGGDGVGKSTQINRLAKRLSAAGVSFSLTREPGGTPFAESLRAFILDPALPPHAAMAEALLFAAARHDHVENLITPALGEGRWVLSDRFADSTRAYQGAAGGLALDTLKRIEGLSHPGLAPDLTIILDLDPALATMRRTQRANATGGGDGGKTADGAMALPAADRFETRGVDFQIRLRNAFRDIAAAEPQRCRLIDAGAPAVVVEAAIWQVVTERLSPERA